MHILACNKGLNKSLHEPRKKKNVELLNTPEGYEDAATQTDAVLRITIV